MKKKQIYGLIFIFILIVIVAIYIYSSNILSKTNSGQIQLELNGIVNEVIDNKNFSLEITSSDNEFFKVGDKIMIITTNSECAYIPSQGDEISVMFLYSDYDKQNNTAFVNNVVSLQ